jgi:multiple sugar transport system permease protein
MTLRRKEALAGYVFALPVIVGLIVFTLGPIVMSAIYSLCSYEVLTPARWIGFQNYNELFTGDPRFWKSLWNTVFYTALSVPLGVAGSLGLAMLLNARIVGRSAMRTLFYLPSIVPIVAASMLFLWLFNGEYGLFNAALRGLGFSPAPWLSDPTWSKPSLVLMSLWGVGGGMIIFLAGLQSIPKHLYEAARIDGAGPIPQFFNITLPMLSPTIFFLLIINTIGAFQVFTQAFLMTNGQGTPLDSTLFYVFYLYRLGFEYFQMGLASAMAWILFVIIIVITAIQFRYSSRWVHAESVE